MVVSEPDPVLAGSSPNLAGLEGPGSDWPRLALVCSDAAGPALAKPFL